MSISKMSPPHQRISVSLQDGVASYGYSWLLHPCKPYWPMPLGTAWPLGTSCPGAKTTSQLFIRTGQKQKSVNTKSISQLLLPIPWMLLFNPAGTGLLQICMQTQSISLWPDSFLLIFLFFFSIRNSDLIYFVLPNLSRQREFEAVFTSKLFQAALTR